MFTGGVHFISSQVGEREVETGGGNKGSVGLCSGREFSHGGECRVNGGVQLGSPVPLASGRADSMSWAACDTGLISATLSGVRRRYRPWNPAFKSRHIGRVGVRPGR